jgi:hypothetical protein
VDYRLKSKDKRQKTKGKSRKWGQIPPLKGARGMFNSCKEIDKRKKEKGK